MDTAQLDDDEHTELTSLMKINHQPLTNQNDTSKKKKWTWTSTIIIVFISLSQIILGVYSSIAQSSSPLNQDQMGKVNDNNNNNNTNNDHNQTPLLFEIPWPTHYINNRNYFHALQSLSISLTDYTIAKDENDSFLLSTADNWKQVRLIWNGPGLNETMIRMSDICNEVFRFFDGRFNSDGTLINEEESFNDHKSSNNSDPAAGSTLTKIIKKEDLKEKLTKHNDFMHRKMDHRSFLWFQRLMESKFGITRIKYKKRSSMIGNNDREQQQYYCKQQFHLNKVSLLLISRDGQRRKKDLSKLALKLKESNILNKVTHIPNLGQLTMKEQAQLFAEHMFSVSPHGATETNLMFANGPHQSEGPPHIAFEIANPYTDCQECRDIEMFISFREMIPWMLTYSIGSEINGINCSIVCTNLRNTNVRGLKLRAPFRDQGIPGDIGMDLMIQLISAKIKQIIIPHCMRQNKKQMMQDYNHSIINMDPFRVATLIIDEQSEQFQKLNQSFFDVTGNPFPLGNDQSSKDAPIKPKRRRMFESEI